MAGPLSALSPSNQNSRVWSPPSTSERSTTRNLDFETIESTTTIKKTTSATYQIYEDPENRIDGNGEREADGEETFHDTSEHVPSSPFVADVTVFEDGAKENWEEGTPSKKKDGAQVELRGGGGSHCEACPSPPKSRPSSASPTKDKTLRSPRSNSPLKKMLGVSRSPKMGEGSPSFGPLSPRSPTKHVQKQAAVEEDTLRFNEGLTRAIDMTQHNDGPGDESQTGSVIHHALDEDMTIDAEVGDEGMSTIFHPSDDIQRQNDDDHLEEGDDTVNMDDTCLSTFSAVPNMTLFSGLRGGSPTKTSANQVAAEWSPSKQLVSATPAISRQSHHSPTRRTQEDEDSTPRRARDDTMDLLNFTGQSNVFAPTPSIGRRVSSRGGFPIRISPTKSHASQERERGRDLEGRGRSASPKKDVLNFASIPSSVSATPAPRRNLLDLDIEPLPTPRSVPTITPRELESLRSDFNSQISSLKATLSGKEAEVAALKKAVEDAEGRVGTGMEEVRSERAAREGLEHEKADWERRGREMETILRDVKQEIMVAEREREKCNQKAEDADKKTEDAQVRILELQTQLDSANKRAAARPMTEGGAAGGDIENAVADAVQATAKELHELYKNKHVEKVAALKKSYEKRWEKKVKLAEDNLKEAQEELEAVKTARDATMSGVIPSELKAREEEEMRTRMELEAEKRKLEARIQGLEQEIRTVGQCNSDLREELERERVEKGELVQAVDAWLAIQDEEQQLQITPAKPERPSAAIQSGLDNLRGSVSRASGLKMPSKIGETRIGRAQTKMPVAASVGNTNAGTAAGRNTSGSRIAGGAPMRSGIMRDIERMGMKG